MAGRHMQFLGLFQHSVIWNKWLVYNRAPMVWLATRQPPLPPHPPWFCCQHPAGRPWLGAARSHTRPIWGSTGPSYTGCLPPTCQLELLLQPLLPVLLGEWLMHISPNYWDASRQVRQTSRLIPSVHISLVLPKLGQWGLTGSTLLQEVPQKDGSKPPGGRRSWGCQEIISPWPGEGLPRYTILCQGSLLRQPPWALICSDGCGISLRTCCPLTRNWAPS